MSRYGQKPRSVSHHPTKFCGFRHCGSGDIMILVCHVILEDHVIKVLKSAITIFSKAHGMSHSHIRNFTIKVALTETFACVSSDSSLILATPSCITNDEIHSLFYKDTGKLGWSSICLRFSQFEPEIMLNGMLNFKTHFIVWHCIWYEHCNGLF